MAPIASCRIAGLAILLAVGAAGEGFAATLAQVMQTGVLRLCANPAALPYSNSSARDGPPGFQIELGEAIAREMRVRLEVVWTFKPSEQGSRACDASLDSVPLAERFEQEGMTGPSKQAVLPILFSRPYVAGGVFLAVRPGSQARRFEEVGSQKIGVLTGSIEHEYLAKKGLNVSVFPSQDEIADAIVSGEIGAGALTLPFIGWYRHTHTGPTIRLPEGYEPEPELRWNLAVRLWHSDDALLRLVNRALDQVIAQRIPDRIYARYGIPYHAPFPPGEISHSARGIP